MKALWLFLWCVKTDLGAEASTSFRLTNFECAAVNKSWLIIHECRLEDRETETPKLYASGTILQKTNSIEVHYNLLKYGRKGSQSIMFQNKYDFCAFMRNRNYPLVSQFHRLLEPFTNMNHTCPYVGEIYLRGFHMQTKLLQIPVPNGDYALKLTWMIQQKKVGITNFYIAFYDSKKIG